MNRRDASPSTFLTTRWSVVAEAAHGGEGRQFLAQLEGKIKPAR